MKPGLIKNTAITTHAALPGNRLYDFATPYHPDEELLQQMLAENRQHDSAFTLNLSTEIINFLQFAALMLIAIPAGLYTRQRIRKNKPLNHILQFRELLPVRSNIEKGSLAYDTILFKQSPVQLLKNRSHLANLVCLAILFGDEFIDGIATEYGKKNIQRILDNNKVDYYLKYKKTGQGYELYYAFNICDMLPATVLESTNSKYKITYRAFYQHLQFLLAEMNRHLTRLDQDKAEEAVQLICKACNKCFDTYKADITSFDQNYSFAELLHYQKTKDDDIIQVLLTLRAVLLNKKQLQYQKQFGSWSSMVRSMQLYDDMQDAATDCDFQMNALCYFAKNFFIEEWQWLQQNKQLLQQLKGLPLHSSICLHMPGSCMLNLQYARNIAHTKLSWVQRKIKNYLWRKNWLGFGNPLLNAGTFCLSAVLKSRYKGLLLKLFFIQQRVLQVHSAFITDDMKWAHIIDTALFDPELKKYLFKRMTRKERYFLTSCYIEFPIKQKARLIKKIMADN